MFKGLSAFPLTPVTPEGIDEKGFMQILTRLTTAKVDSLGVLGSTGNYAYLTQEQRKRIITLAKELAGDIPVMAGIGAVSTEQVLRFADDAQACGANALLLPAMSYQKLTDDEVYGLYEAVSHSVSVPVCVYDNPGTTHFEFSDDLHGRIAMLPHIRSIKIPGVPAEAALRVRHLREKLPVNVTIGISGDAFAGAGLNAGCEVWYSVCGGLFPHTAKAITQAAGENDRLRVTELTDRLEPLWKLYRKHGSSLRVTAAAAAILELTNIDCLPRPLKPLSRDEYSEIKDVIVKLGLK